MAGKNRRKRRAHRARAATTTRSKARQRQAASARAVRASLATASENTTPALSPSREPAKVVKGSLHQISAPVTPAFGWLGRMPIALVPGRVFFAMGRPGAGLACCVLQASVLGWLPATLWAAWAQGGWGASTAFWQPGYARPDRLRRAHEAAGSGPLQKLGDSAQHA